MIKNYAHVSKDSVVKILHKPQSGKPRKSFDAVRGREVSNKKAAETIKMPRGRLNRILLDGIMTVVANWGFPLTKADMC